MNYEQGDHRYRYLPVCLCFVFDCYIFRAAGSRSLINLVGSECQLKVSAQSAIAQFVAVAIAIAVQEF